MLFLSPCVSVVFCLRLRFLSTVAAVWGAWIWLGSSSIGFKGAPLWYLLLGKIWLSWLRLRGQWIV